MHGFAFWSGAIDSLCGAVNCDNCIEKSCCIGIFRIVLRQRLKFLVKNCETDSFGIDLKTLNLLAHILHAFEDGGGKFCLHVPSNSAQRQDDSAPPVP